MVTTAVFGMVAGLLVASPTSTAVATTPTNTNSGSIPIPASVFRINTTDKVAFITIDDGVFKPQDALDYVTKNQIPVTAFLSAWAIKGSADYFNQMTKWGSIQAHSATHASFAKPTTDLQHEICYVQRRYKKQYGWNPWMLRPPYGAAHDSQQVRRVGQSCGIQQIVMWGVVIGKGKVAYRNKGITKGSIILLHYDRDLKRNLRLAMKKIKAAGLTPGNLATYLPRKYVIPDSLLFRG